jgi:ligand-binding sensor domain-containing protein
MRPGLAATTLTRWSAITIAVAVSSVLAQPAPAEPIASRLSQLRQEHWDGGGELSEVTALAQTPDGYLWIGSPHGLFRFDGAHFTRFDEDSAPDALPASRVRSLLVARDGALYIGTDGGLAVRRAAD